MFKGKREMGTVYVVKNRTNSKSYVGLTTKSLDVRWYYHLRAAAHEKPRQLLAKAIKKYGPENFEMTVIEECATDAQLREREKYWIEEMGTFVDRGGYNMTRGGDGLLGYRHTDAAKKSMSLRRTGALNHNFGKKDWGFQWTEEAKQKLSDERKGSGNPMYGKHHSEEAKVKISAAGCVRVRHTRNVVMLDNDGNVLSTFVSAKVAALEIQGSESKISDCCRGGRISHKGYCWKYTT